MISHFDVDFFMYLNYLVYDIIDKKYINIPPILKVKDIHMYEKHWSENWLNICNKYQVIYLNTKRFNYKIDTSTPLFNKSLKEILLYYPYRLIRGTGTDGEVTHYDFLDSLRKYPIHINQIEYNYVINRISLFGDRFNKNQNIMNQKF